MCMLTYVCMYLHDKKLVTRKKTWNGNKILRLIHLEMNKSKKKYNIHFLTNIVLYFEPKE